jgi:hypothetical protein
MRTTVTTIREWLKEAQKQGATHMIVACDTFNYEDYPVFVMLGENARTIAAQHNNPGEMTRLMEVYNLSMDIEAQLAPGTKVFNY